MEFNTSKWGICMPYYNILRDTDQNILNIAELGKKYPHANLWVASGESYSNHQFIPQGQSLDNAIDILHEAGVKVLFYVYTTSNGISLNQINAMVDDIFDRHPTGDGVYFDEYDGNSGGLALYTSVCEHTRTRTDNIFANAHGRTADWFNLPNAPDVSTVLELGGFDHTPQDNLHDIPPWDAHRKGTVMYNSPRNVFTDEELRNVFFYGNWNYATHAPLQTCWTTVSSYLEDIMRITSEHNDPVRLQYASDQRADIKTQSVSNDTPARIRLSNGSKVGFALNLKTDNQAGIVRTKTSGMTKCFSIVGN